uniref:Holin n=1 Tax=viral metagenome TaxID=1070528 RepID=A0A6M3M342_9ZZZZ
MDIADRLMKFLEGVLSWGHLGILGSFGGIANYYYLNATKNRTFLWGLLCANVVLAFFLGKVLGGFIPEDNEFRDSIVMLIGFFAFPIVNILEARVVAYIDRLLSFGGK